MYLESLQAHKVAHGIGTPLVCEKCPEDASKLPAAGFENALIWQNANQRRGICPPHETDVTESAADVPTAGS